jgi:hypothetical protein
MPELDGINTTIQAINEQSDEQFRIEVDGDSVALYNGDTLITEDFDYEIEARVLQIAKENGVWLD